MVQENPEWLDGIIKKRTPDALRVLMDLLQAGLRKGECTANDIRDVYFDKPNIIGATFKLLPKFGFVHTDRRVKTTTKRKHARRVDVWELSSPHIAREYITHVGRVLIDSKPQQLSLL